ncbi:MAG: sensor histidine kinase [Blastocatellia bacterium]
MVVIAGMLLLLLPLLAFLQYRWLGQLSEGEREMIKTRLRSMAGRFGQDFDRELTGIYAALAPEREMQSAEHMRSLPARYEAWRARAQNPGLIRDLFMVRLKGSDQLALSQLRPVAQTAGAAGSHEFVECEWPADMSSLRQRMEQYYQNLRTAQLSQSQDTSVRGLLRPIPPVDGDLPALVMTPMSDPVINENREITFRTPSEYLVVRLDLNEIQSEILPALAQRYFHGDEADYSVDIVTRAEQPRLIYQYGQHLLAAPEAAADVTAGLFSIRFEQLRERRASERSEQNAAGGPAAAPSPASSPTAQNNMGPPREFRPWQIEIRHRSGSLEAAVASVRRRNLFLGFGVLALLAASVALLLLSARRAQHLAWQQIEFVAGVSHELRTPLAVIRSAGDNLADGVIRDSDQTIRYGRLIRDEGRRLSEMVEQVLEFAGIRSGRKTYELHPAVAADVIETAIAATQQQLTDAGFVVEKNIATGLPDIMADRSALARALQNLISNAVKYSPENRWIGIHARRMAQGKTGGVEIVIEDHGIGIPPAELSHIFEPFYRGSEAVSAQIHGNGLGLSLVHSILEAHHGTISVRSNPGRGTAFTMFLPAAQPADPQTMTTGQHASARA